MSIETMKQALEALEDAMTIPGAWPAGREAIATLRTAIEQAEKQDAVAWINWSALTGERRLGWECESEIASEPLYTTPPAAPVQEPVGCEGAIVNGRVYADRLEHDYKFECEAGPLHLCTDWVEFRRCFEWLAEHTTPPEAQRQSAPAPEERRSAWVGLTDEEVMQAMSGDWTSQFYFARAIEAKLREKNTGETK